MVALTFFVALPIGLIWVVTDPQARGYLSTAVLALCLLEPLGWLYVWASSSGEKGQHHAQSGRDG